VRGNDYSFSFCPEPIGDTESFLHEVLRSTIAVQRIAPVELARAERAGPFD
jgi:hypothetical protein